VSDEWKTRQSLLIRAKDPTDEEAWAEFVKFYENFIYHILHQLNINPSDCSDLVQDILVKLWKSLKTYDTSQAKFRNWLGRVVRNAAFDHFDAVKSRRTLLEKERDIVEALHATSSSDMEKLVEEEWMLYLTNQALDRLREIFSGEAVNVLSLTLDGLSVEKIAKQLNLSPASVYTLRSRVKSRFIKEVRALMHKVEA